MSLEGNLLLGRTGLFDLLKDVNLSLELNCGYLYTCHVTLLYVVET